MFLPSWPDLSACHSIFLWPHICQFDFDVRFRLSIELNVGTCWHCCHLKSGSCCQISWEAPVKYIIEWNQPKGVAQVDYMLRNWYFIQATEACTSRVAYFTGHDLQWCSYTGILCCCHYSHSYGIALPRIPFYSFIFSLLSPSQLFYDFALFKLRIYVEGIGTGERTTSAMLAWQRAFSFFKDGFNSSV